MNWATFWGILGWGSLASAGIGGILALIHPALNVIDHWQEVRVKIAQAQEAKARAKHAARQLLKRDERGFFGGWIDEAGNFVDADQARVISPAFDHAVLDTAQRHAAQLAHLLLTAGGMPKGSEVPLQEMIQPRILPELPAHIPIDEVLHRVRPSLETIPIGMTLTENGIVPVHRPAYDLMHMLLVGETGSGKSKTMDAFLYTLTNVREAFSVVAFAPDRASFNYLEGWDRLHCPIARDEESILGTLQLLIRELERRQQLLAEHPEAEHILELGEPAIFAFMEEGITALQSPKAKEYFGRILREGRKCAIWVYFSAQTGNASIFASSTDRNNFVTRLAFAADRNITYAALQRKPDGPLPEIEGRAWAMLKGPGGPIQVQVPYVSRRQLLNAIHDHHGGPVIDVVPTVIQESTSAEREWERKVLAAWESFTPEQRVSRGIKGRIRDFNGYTGWGESTKQLAAALARLIERGEICPLS